MFFPEADAAILSCRLPPPPAYPRSVGPIFDPHNAHVPCPSWSASADKFRYTPQYEPFAPAIAPEQPLPCTDRYLRAPLARNERLRLSMFWYYTCDIMDETEFLSGLQEKVCIAQESTGWECAIVGILDVNLYHRLAAVGVPLGILPRGETLCAHTVAQPPGCVFLLPNMLQDWRYAKSPYVEFGGLTAYAGAPLRLQDQNGESVCLGTICVASPTSQSPLPKAQQATLARLADWIVADLVQLTRARRQRERRRMVDMLATAQEEADTTISEEPVMRILRAAYPGAAVSLQLCKSGQVGLEGRDTVALSDFSNSLWEDDEFINNFVVESNHLEPPVDRTIRAIAVPCESVSGNSYLVVGVKDFRKIFDDIDAWFAKMCATIVSQMWHKRLLAEVMTAKEKLLRGFSHQLRTPVHGILGSVELLAENLRSPNLAATAPTAPALIHTAATSETERDHELYLDTIKRAGRDLISIINSMITLNRWADVATTQRRFTTHTTYELETELLNETKRFISGDSRYSVSVFFNQNRPPGHCRFKTDLGLMRDSILPVIVNAIQSTIGGIVATSISVCPESKELTIDVTDTGRGIPAEDHQRIFELYEQIDEYSTGAGLGLTLPSRFAALLQGSVELVSSVVGVGSHFKFTFREVEFDLAGPVGLSEPMIELSPRMPRHYQRETHTQNSLSLGSHFAQSLPCYGFVESENAKNALIILDFVADAEQHLTALSRIPSDRIVICIIPYSNREGRLGDAPSNVIYVQGPFGTRTLASTLGRAEELILRLGFEPCSEGDTDAKRGLTVSPGRDRGGCAAAPDSVTVGNVEQEPLPQYPMPIEPYRTEEKLQAEHARLEQHRPLAPTLENDLTNLELDVSNKMTANARQANLEPYQDFKVVPKVQKPFATSHPTALLVDDNAVNLRVMQMYCKKRGLEYLCATDGLEAVSVFKARQKDSSKAAIQVILMDLQMPVCDGIEATKRIRQAEEDNDWDKSVVLIVTGQDSLADREAADEAGSQEFHVKPVSMKTLDTSLGRFFANFQK